MWNAVNHCLSSLVLRAVLGGAVLGSLLASRAAGQGGCVYDWATGAPYPGMDSDTLYGMIGWDPDGPGPAGDQVIISANFNVAGNLFVPGRRDRYDPGIVGWTGSEYRPFFAYPPDERGACTGMGTYDPDGEGPLPERLYATRNPAFTLDVWNGLTWDQVSFIGVIGAGANFSPQAHLQQFDPDGDGPRNPLLIIAGTSAGGSGVSTDRILAFDGTNMLSLDPGTGFNGNIFGLTLHDPDGSGPAKADLIVWGQFSNFSGTPMMQIARYDGTAFHALGNGLGTNDPNFDERVYAAASYDADGDGPGLPRLIATGQFSSSGGTPTTQLAVWNGTGWAPLVNGFGANVGTSLVVSPRAGSPTNANDLFLTGGFGVIDGVSVGGVARFDGTSWHALTDVETGQNGPGGFIQRAVAYDPDGAGPLQRRLAMWGAQLNYPSRNAIGVIEYDLGAQVYRAMPGVTGINTPQNLTVYDSDGAGPALPKVIIGHGALTNYAPAQADSSLFDGRDFIAMPPNPNADGVAVCVWDADGAGPGNPLAVFSPSFSGGGFQAWNGTSWNQLPGTPYPLPSGGDPDMQLVSWDPDGSGALTPRLVATTYATYSNGAALNGISQFDGTSWSGIGAGFSAGVVRALTTWDPNNSGVRRLIAVGTEDLASNGVPVTGVTMFDGTNWVPVGNIAPFNDPGRPFLTVTAWDRDGPGPLPEVLVAGRQFSTFIYDGSAWTLEIPISREVMTQLSTWDRDGSGPELPLLTICSSQVQANGGGFYAYDRFFSEVQYAGSDVNAAVPYDPDGPGPAPEMLCIGGRFSFVNTSAFDIDAVVAHRFAFFDKFNDLWANPTSGTFDDPSRWECGTAPRPVNSVVFDATQSGYTAGPYTVTLPAGSGPVEAERMRVRTDSVTLNLNGRTFETTEQGTFVDPALIVGEIADTPASLNISNSGAPADLDLTTLAIGQTRGSTPAVQQVRVQSANARLLVSGDSLIGHRATSSTLALQSGADAVLSGGVSIGDQPLSAGSLTAVGTGTTLLHSAAGESMAVGLRGSGYLQIGGVSGGQAGAVASTIGEMDVLSIGSLNGGVGNVVVSGAGSLWDADARIIAVGYGGNGTVDVAGGATWRTSTSASLAIAAFPGSTGLVRLRGSGTLWEELTSVLTVGSGGTLDVGPGAVFSAPAMTINTGGRLIGSGTVNAPPGRAVLQVFNFGQIDPEPETGPGTGVATLTIDGDLVQSSVTEGPQTILDVPFEAPAFILGPINGQSGWTGDGVVQGSVVNSGAQALLIDASNAGGVPTATRPFNFALANLPVRLAVDFRRSGSVHAQCGFAVFGNTGFIAQMANVGGGNYILGNTNTATPARNFPDNMWHRLEILLNYQARTMTASIDGVSLGQLAINNANIPSAITGVSIYSFGSSGTQFIHADNLSVATVLPPGSVPNKSGVVAVDVAGTAPGLFDKVVVNGSATVGGGFQLRLANGFNPAPGSINNLELFTAAAIANPSGRFDVAYFPGLPSRPDGTVPYFKLDYNESQRAFSVGVSLGTLQPPNFNDPTTFNVAGGPTSAATGDFNSDGFLDLAVTVPDPVNPTTTNGLAVVLLNAGVSGNTWLGFGSQVSVTVGRNPNGIAVGRFRGPAQPLDIAVANTTDGSVMRVGNSGGGTPSFAVAATLNNVGVNPVSLVASDLNADGTVDLAVANSGIVGFDPGNARILPNNGSGTFSNGTVLITGFNPVSIAAARINGDTFDDLVTANSESANISVFLRDASALTTVAGDSFLPPRTRPTSPRPVEVVPGGLGNPKDLDNDVAVVCQPQSSPGSVDVFANRGDGSGDLSPSVPLPVGEETSSLALLDMDNDGDTDIATLAAGTGPNAGSRVIRVLRNDSANAGSGQLIFALQPGEITANSPTLIRAGDVNNDGQRDLVTVNSTTGTLAARPGEPLPNGRIARADQTANADPFVLAPPDRVVNPIAVVRTATPPPLCPGDLNNDNAVNTADLVAFLGRFGTTVPPYTLGDLNGDGAVNTSDLVVFLGRFGQACP